MCIETYHLNESISHIGPHALTATHAATHAATQCTLTATHTVTHSALGQSTWGSLSNRKGSDEEIRHMLQCVAACCSGLQCGAVCCSATCCRALQMQTRHPMQSVAARCSALQCLTGTLSIVSVLIQIYGTRCSVLQHVAVLLQWVAGSLGLSIMSVLLRHTMHCVAV